MNKNLKERKKEEKWNEREKFRKLKKRGENERKKQKTKER